MQSPKKRLIPAINAMVVELEHLHTVIDWQKELVSSLRTVLSPETHLEPVKSLRENTFGIEDCILDKTDEELQDQIDMISSSTDHCRDLIGIIKGETETLSDDHNRAILVFTVVTVVFLPMSFVASYLSMNGGPSEPHWSKTQSLFWEITAPMALGLGLFCLGVAWAGSELQAARTWMNEFKARWTGRIGQRGDETAEDESEGLEDA